VDQPVLINGTGFQGGAGLRVRVNWPGGQTDLTGAQVVWQSPNQIRIHIRVGTTAADWTAQVINGNGRTSNVFGFAVTASPTILEYSWSPPPTAGQPFSGTITGTGFVSGMEVWFCRAGTNDCSRHPAAGVRVNEPTSLSVIDVNLISSGSYQFYLQTSAGQSARSTSFIVQEPASSADPQKPIAAFTMSGGGKSSSSPNELQVTAGPAGVATINLSAAASRDPDSARPNESDGYAQMH
jgi:hypothetical protein